jgi:hypothetical protein
MGAIKPVVFLPVSVQNITYRHIENFSQCSKNRNEKHAGEPKKMSSKKRNIEEKMEQENDSDVDSDDDSDDPDVYKGNEVIPCSSTICHNFTTKPHVPGNSSRL